VFSARTNQTSALVTAFQGPYSSDTHSLEYWSTFTLSVEYGNGSNLARQPTKQDIWRDNQPNRTTTTTTTTTRAHTQAHTQAIHIRLSIGAHSHIPLSIETDRNGSNLVPQPTKQDIWRHNQPNRTTTTTTTTTNNRTTNNGTNQQRLHGNPRGPAMTCQHLYC
jgi:hypothetical protein